MILYSWYFRRNRGDIVLYQEYAPDVLKKLQETELSVLKDFDRFCRERNIEYFGCGGTLLGAVRHRGFIPWDDDLDVGMTREHYDRFLKAAREDREGEYTILNAETEESFPVMITKWYRKGTVFRDDDAVVCGYRCGIGVDIFCFDNVADDRKKLRRQAAKAWCFGKLLILRQISRPTIYAGGWKGQAAAAAAGCVSRILKVLGISSGYLYRQAKEAALRYRDQKTERVAFLFDPTPYTSMLRRSDIYPTRELSFEGIKLKFPHRPRVYLRTRYGKDYMKLPPKEKRHNHPPAELSFQVKE
ncbi:MAG: LicD family protein [Ruminococcus sp.]|jgi:lipopolysaccharide cholinephosphotransferase